MLLLSQEKIWDKAAHNAFTDLIYYQDQFLCAFRESDSHQAGACGKIRILASRDGKEWNSIALLELPGIDLRDPKLSEMPDGRLLLNMGGAHYNEKGISINRKPCVAFSKGGREWTPITILADLAGEWIWRVTWQEGVGYGASYSSVDPKDPKSPWILKLFKTTDGLQYEFVTQLDVSCDPNETTLRVDAEGKMVALVRRNGNGWIGSATFPFTDWQWHEIDYRLGGPNFLILPEGEMWATSRLIQGEGKYTITKTALASMTLTSYSPALVFPSGGDTSYPGMVYHKQKLYISYYSTHEGKASIYFLIVQL